MKIRVNKNAAYINGLLKSAKENILTNINEAIRNVDEAYELSISNQDTLCTSKCYLMYGLINIQKNDYTLANEAFEDCLELCDKTRDVNTKFAALISLGDLRVIVNDYDSALENYLSALNIVSKFQSKAEKARILYRLGKIYVSLEYYELAISYFMEIIQVLEEEQSELEESHESLLDNINAVKVRFTFSYIAECYMSLGEFDRAKDYIKRAIDKGIENSDAESLGYAYFVFAKYFVACDGIDEAKIYFNRAISKFNIAKAEELLIMGIAEYGIMLFKLEQFHEAKDALYQALKRVNSSIEYKLELIIYLYLAKIHEQFEEYELAFTYYKRYSQIKTVYDETWKNIKAKSVISKYEKARSDIRLKELETINLELEMLSSIGKDIISTLKKKEIIEITKKSIEKLVECTSIGIGLVNKKNKMDYYLFDGDQANKITYDINTSERYIAYLFRKGRDVINNDFDYIRTESKYGKVKGFNVSRTGSLMVCPIVLKDDVVGLIVLTSASYDKYNKQEMNLLKILSSYVATAVNNHIKSQEIINKNRKLKELTEKDGLTKVYNRHALSSRIDFILKKARKQEKPYSTIMIDVDYFKEYNDNYGHAKGDLCLQRVANVLKKIFNKETDYVYRYGGDEFMILALNQSKEEIANLVEKVREEIHKLEIEHKYSRKYNQITLSIGVATIFNKDMEYKESLLAADKALYVSKGKGRNQYSQIVI